MKQKGNIPMPLNRTAPLVCRMISRSLSLSKRYPAQQSPASEPRQLRENGTVLTTTFQRCSVFSQCSKSTNCWAPSMVFFGPCSVVLDDRYRFCFARQWYFGYWYPPCLVPHSQRRFTNPPRIDQILIQVQAPKHLEDEGVRFRNYLEGHGYDTGNIGLKGGKTID